MSPHDFADLVNRETGLEVGADDLHLPFDALAAWDSMYLITVATAVETRTGRNLALVDALDCTTLEGLRELISR